MATVTVIIDGEEFVHHDATVTISETFILITNTHGADSPSTFGYDTNRKRSLSDIFPSHPLSPTYVNYNYSIPVMDPSMWDDEPKLDRNGKPPPNYVKLMTDHPTIERTHLHIHHSRKHKNARYDKNRSTPIVRRVRHFR